jgi:hypothetical protein
MSYELAHAVTQYGNERMSRALLTQLGGAALSAALMELWYPDRCSVTLQEDKPMEDRNQQTHLTGIF